MRIFLVILLASSTLAMAQRPFLFQSRLSNGPAGKVHTLKNSLYLYDTVASRSFDHGATWEPMTTLVGKVCVMSDFTADIALAVTQEATTNLVRCFFSTSGSTWTQFDSLTLANRPTHIAAIAETWYLATDASKIYMFTSKLDSIDLGALSIIDLVAHGSDLVASTTKGIRISSDGGKVWNSINTDGLGILHVSGDNIYATSVSGVKKIDIANRRVENVGRWDSLASAPVSLDIDSYQGVIYTFVRGESYQLYVLEGDTVWKEVAYPLPGTTATVTSSVMTMDAGFVIINHQLTQGFTDSSGVYAYDLNDFTSVDIVELQSNEMKISISGNGFTLNCDRNGEAQVIVVDVLGRILTLQHVQSTVDAFINIPSMQSGFFGVIVRYKDNTVQRGHFLY
ncbi:MAG: hypothetical protein H7X70_04460 [Candidatus Kapabacteria bacterium]|nr:hypothetical protein [Candidatus Kapabacteria bacterium]